MPRAARAAIRPQPKGKGGRKLVQTSILSYTKPANSANHHNGGLKHAQDFACTESKAWGDPVKSSDTDR
jgi:hypothetical protein